MVYKMSWVALVGLALMLSGVLLPTTRFTLQKKGYRLKLIQDVVLALFLILCGLGMFFQGWRYEQSGGAVFVITVLTVTNIYWVINDLKRD